MIGRILRNVFVILFVLVVSPLVANAAETFDIDTAHTKVGFSVTHLAFSEVEGRFREFAGQVVWDAADPTKSAISGTIKTASIWTDNDKRDEHLRGADFFDVAAHPEITFKSTKIEKAAAGYVAHGDLTIRGVTKGVDVPFTVSDKVNDPFDSVRIALKGSLSINRKDFGVSWNKTMDKGGFVLGDTVQIDLRAEAILKQ